jgi:hypothetical protein
MRKEWGLIKLAGKDLGVALNVSTMQGVKAVGDQSSAG